MTARELPRPPPERRAPDPKKARELAEQAILRAKESSRKVPPKPV